MTIDAKQLKEIYPYKLQRRVNKKERFYLIPKDERYALSDYGQLVFSEDGEIWKQIKREYREGHEVFNIQWHDSTNKEFVSLESLFKMVFFPSQTHCRLILQPDAPKNGKRDRWSYNVCNAHIVYDKNQIVEYILAKTQHRMPNYPQEQYRHTFINRNENFTNYAAYMTYANANQRGRDPMRKARRKDNKDSTICEEWEHPQKMLKWIMETYYYYSGDYGKLQLDKDLKSLGNNHEYSPTNCCFIPANINMLLRKTKNKSKRAAVITEFVEIERGRGEIPGELLNYLLEWAQRDMNDNL